MCRKSLLFFIFLYSLIISGCYEKPVEISPNQKLVIEIQNLVQGIEKFKNAVNATGSEIKIQQHFKECRLLYKNIEWAVEYFVPETARFINGPALDELETDENKFLPPNGFQVMEEMIFPHYAIKNKKEILNELAILKANLLQVSIHINAITISESHTVDALRLELYRIITLGITGFDSPIALHSIPEAAASLTSLEKTIQGFSSQNSESKKTKHDVINLLKKAETYCVQNIDFNSFDRATFIRNYLNPISKAIGVFQKANHIVDIDRNNAINPDAASLFETNTFNVNAFIPSNEYAYSDEKAKLGEKLFYEEGLSKSKNRSCASCHLPEKAFTDGLKINVSLTGIALNRNTPTLTYASLQNAQFWDMRQSDLEKQSKDVITNKDEMHGSLQSAVGFLTNDKVYKVLYSKAFPKTKKPEEWQVQNAIASYIRSLNRFNSRFDEFMRGDSEKLSSQEVKGFNLFAGKAKCATCHFIPLFNGTVPPNYSKTEQEVIGTPSDKNNTALSSDLGRFFHHKMPQLRNAFKTPTLRNSAKTAPYMHNGVFETLEEVIDFYNKGGGVGIGLTVENQTLPSDKLNLNKEEINALIAFMKTLDDQ